MNYIAQSASSVLAHSKAPLVHTTTTPSQADTSEIRDAMSKELL
jgi:hypothetical protein